MKKEATARQERFQANFNLYVMVLLGLIILVGVNILSFRQYWRKDLSINRYFELSPKTIDMLKKLDSPVTITTFLGTSELKVEIEQLVREYQYVGKDKVIIQNVDPQMDLAKAEELAKKFKFGAMDNLVIFEYKDRHKYVSDTSMAEFDMGGMMMGGGPRKMKEFKGEAQFTGAIQGLIEGKTAKVYFVTGHGERELANSQPTGLSGLATRIKGENIEAKSINLASGEIPADADAVVIAGPRAPFSSAEVQLLSNYLEQKGKLVVMQDPKVVSGLEPLLEKYGIKLRNDIVVTRGMSVMGNQLVASVDVEAVAETYAEHPSVRFLNGFNLQIPGSRSVDVADNAPQEVKSKVTILVKTGQESWGETNFTDLAARKVQFDTGIDAQGPVGIAALYDGGEVPGEKVNTTGARLLVVGSSAFLMNHALGGTSVDFFNNTLNWMMKREAAIGISPKTPKEYALKLAPLQQRSVYLMACIVLPFAALALGVAMWLRRRR